MDKGNRLSIGIIFNFTKGWLGGFYYYQNIIKAINCLDDHEKPKLVIFYNKDYSEYLVGITYPYLQLVPWSFVGIYKAYVLSPLVRKNIFVDKMINDYHLDGIYPVNDNPVPAATCFPTKTIGAAWFPDLQHRFYPQFFDRKRLWLRELRLKMTLRNASDLVVSSFDTVQHFQKFYKIKDSLRIHVLQFVSILDKYETEDIQTLRATYNIPQDYFIVSNAFLKHKNHMLVLKAIRVLKEENNPAHVVFTGRMDVYDDGVHIAQIKNYMLEHGLREHVSLLGIIPRNHQLCIMKHARSVVQPSFFEGWNTTIEDAKTLKLPVIASDIAVHKEQLQEKGFYFDPEDENDLAAVLKAFGTKAALEPDYGDNTERAKNFGRTFLNIFKPHNGKANP